MVSNCRLNVLATCPLSAESDQLCCHYKSSLYVCVLYFVWFRSHGWFLYTFNL